jgi:hypothetical protein
MNLAVWKKGFHCLLYGTGIRVRVIRADGILAKGALGRSEFLANSSRITIFLMAKDSHLWVIRAQDESSMR